jgi:peptidoglycan hydrolase-like protein with peptidoglycan-binding domain
MKRILLASAACLALSSFPALAQNSGGQSNASSMKSQTQQSQAVNEPSKSTGQQQAQMIQPSSLSKEQVREIQTNLDKDGFSAKRVDGIWGPETRDALMNFQKTKNLPGNGELNQQTLAALGVNLNNQARMTGSMSNQSQAKVSHPKPAYQAGSKMKSP